ncbi:hypothetical protein LguiA_004876 [Lonicera macranthoides]
MIEMDYVDAWPNTNEKSDFLFPAPPVAPPPQGLILDYFTFNRMLSLIHFAFFFLSFLWGYFKSLFMFMRNKEMAELTSCLLVFHHFLGSCF